MQLIGKFNRLITNKIVWGAFALLICVAFVLSGVSTRGCAGAENPRSSIEGTIAGEAVTGAELGAARFTVSRGRDFSSDPAGRRLLRMNAWNHIATLKEAKRIGIEVPPEAVFEALLQDPAFQVENRFQRPQYEMILRRQGMTPEVYEEYLRQLLTREGHYNLLSAAAWTPLQEIEEMLTGITDLFTVEVVVLPTKKFAGDVKADEQQVQAYYDNNQSYLEVPEKARVKYVAIPISNFMAQAAQEIDDIDVQLFYTNNMAAYTTTDTNEVTVTQSFAQVEARIRNRLERDEALYFAKEAALDFSSLLLPSSYREVLTMEEAARRQELNVVTTRYFSASEYLPGIEGAFDFTRTAFDLDPSNLDDSISDAIVGDNYVYIAQAIDRQEPYVPKLEDIRAKVVKLANEQEQRSALTEKAEAVHDEIEDQIVEGTPFTEVAAKYGLNVVTSQTFTVYPGLMEDLPGATYIPQAVMRRQAGELTDPIPTEEGAVIAFVSSRQMGDMTQSAMLRPQVVQQLDRMTASVLISEWAKNLLDRLDFKDNNPIAVEPTVTEDEPEAVPTEEEEEEEETATTG